MNQNSKYYTGWIPDCPDFRDFTVTHKEFIPMLEKANIKDAHTTLPSKIDLRDWFSPVENQENLNSCTANAGVALIEYFEKKAFGTYIDGSRLFLYKATRNLLGLTGDTGAYLRTTMGAMRLFGVLPEKYWMYKINNYDVEPPAFCYSFAQNYKTMKYAKLDPIGTSREELLQRIKTNVAAGIPAMFGFSMYSSVISQSRSNGGKIPMPAMNDNLEGSHAIVVAGYNDDLVIQNSATSQPTKGAILIRNSWGEEWGEAGYGWLPYEYILKGLAIDWWTLLSNEWVDTDKFGL